MPTEARARRATPLLDLALHLEVKQLIGIRRGRVDHEQVASDRDRLGLPLPGDPISRQEHREVAFNCIRWKQLLPLQQLLSSRREFSF